MELYDNPVSTEKGDQGRVGKDETTVLGEVS
jgi:hypothetical protein